MSSNNEIPWSAKPKNGIKAFFTEETFNKWIGQDTHESRMEERLNKIGISLSSKLTDPLFLTPSASAESECNVKEKTETECDSQFSLKAEFDEVDKEPAIKTNNNKVKEESSEIVLNSFSVRSKETVQNDGELYKQSEVLDTKLPHNTKKIDESQPFFRTSMKREEEFYPVEQKFEMETNQNSIGKRVGIQDRKIVTDTKEIKTGKDDMLLTCRTEPETPEFKEDVGSIAMETEFVRPFSFYKECSEEHVHVKEVEEEENVASKQSKATGASCLDNDVNRKLKRSVTESTNSEITKEAASEKTEPTKQVDEPLTEEEERKLQKQLLNQDKMFFNIRDRNAERYFPDVFKKRPRNRRSKLTYQEQKHYLDLFRSFGKVDANTPEIQDENFKKYLKMKVIVSKEQELFQNYLKSISFTCKKDYEYIHPEVEKYVSARFLVKRRECFKYPRFYSSVSTFDLPGTVAETPPTMKYVRPLLELGIVSKLVLPSIFPGLPQPCVTTSFKRINELCPIIKGVYKGTYVWNKVVCSQDANAEQLAVPNKCDFVMPSSAVKRLVDNQGKIFKYWDMPFTVREYKISEGDKTAIHKVIYIDKPLIRQTQNVPKDNIQLYQKHAIRASAIKSNVRGHVFCGIKPVHELVKMPTFEEIQIEINDYESKIKEAVNKESVLEYDGEDGSPQSKAFQKRKRKHGQVGVFDLENDIDDLETFGMDSVIVSRGKSDGDKGMHVEPLKSSREKTEDSCTIVKRGRKSTKEDLETLKHELECIKSQAIKESFKHAEMVKVIKDNKQETEDHIHGSADRKDNLISNVESACESSREKENDNDLVIQNENKTADSYEACTGNRKERKDILNVKSSLSEKMKQMSTIKSKLQQRIKRQYLSAEAGVADSVSSEVKEWSSDSSADAQYVAEISATDRIDEDKNEAILVQKSVETASDSDSEDGGLVIDVQSDSPIIKARNRKPSKCDNTETTSLPKTISNYAKERTGGESDKCIIDDSLSEKAIENYEESVGKEKLKGGKRRNAADYAYDISVPKKILMSKRKSATDALESAKLSQQAVISSNEEDGILGDGITSVTEGKSQPKTGGQFPGRNTSQEEHIDNSVPIKRGRGRPKKQLQQGQKRSVKRENISGQGSFTEISKDVTEESSAGTAYYSGMPILVNEIRKESIVETIMHSEKESSAGTANYSGMPILGSEIRKEGIVETIMHSEKEDEGNPEIKNDQDTTFCEKFPRRSRRSNMRRLDSDEDSKDATAIDLKKCKNELKKDISECEARKIKEISEAMRKRIEENKKKIREEKCKKIQQSGKSKSEKSNKHAHEIFDMSEKTDHSQSTAGATGGGGAAAVAESNCNDEREVLLNTEEKKIDDFGQDQGLENILKLQDKMHQSSTNKGTLAEVFTQKHGMSHCGFPLDGNVTYHQWNLAGMNVLIRSKYHGFITGQGLVHISPKVEYQPNFGYEQDSVNEICKNWISVYIRPNSTLLKPRINPFNSEIMMFEHVAYKDLVQPDSLFKPAQAFTDLHVILDKLKSLPVGQYLLKNNPIEDQFTILKATEHEKRGNFDLHLSHSSFIKSVKPPPVQWTPLDTTLMLPHQRKMNLIPCTFQPKDAKNGEKKQEKNKKKRKRKKNK